MIIDESEGIFSEESNNDNGAVSHFPDELSKIGHEHAHNRSSKLLNI